MRAVLTKLAKYRNRVFRTSTGERAKAYSKANKRSYDHDVQRMKHLMEEFGNRQAEDITRGEIQKWLDSKADKWSLATRNRHLALLKLTYRLAEEDGKIRTNPARLVRQSKEDNGRVRYLSDVEDTALRSVIQKSYAKHLPEFKIALMTGMRRGEQFSPEWNDVDFDAGTIRLQTSKNGKSRFVHLNTRLWPRYVCCTAGASGPDDCSRTSNRAGLLKPRGRRNSKISRGMPCAIPSRVV